VRIKIIKRTGFADVAGPEHHDLHGLVGHAVQRRVLRYGDQQEVTGPGAHGGRCRVSRQPHLAALRGER